MSIEKSIESSPSFQTSFASLSLHMTDKIRLLQFPSADIISIREIIQTKWPLGIQDERMYAKSHEFKLRGNPWNAHGSDGIPARILMRSLLAHLYGKGWILTASTDVSRKQSDKDTLMFRKQVEPPLAKSMWMAISFSHSDRLRLMGAGDDLIMALRGMLKVMGLLQDESWKDRARDAYEFKLYGSPWWPTGESTMATRLLLLKMVEMLEKFGWSLYASVDQNNGHTEFSETDSWYCVKDRDWVPGMPVVHR